ncbi:MULTISPECIES: hypothetical protein [Streptomyces]|uniref:hypothetical protein n=1 Tax=Streptomyces arenae TaxID=29301 RepID=UPI001055A4D4|nr:hypothetical protein [Streptomyces arenae]MCG7203303.1 hypothetical protein [Streptomyces arenae]
MNLEYRVAHVAERLAEGQCGELGVRAEIRGGAVLLTGTVPSAGCRDDILRVVHDELPDVPVHSDLVVAENAPPDHPEELT